MTTARITKVLSANDTGDTGGHQAGMLVPKDPRILAFFPFLNPREHNPRCHLIFEDESGEKWELAFIYYNNRFFGGTRNEYRLTRMTRFIRERGLESGDEVSLERSPSGILKITTRRSGAAVTELLHSEQFVLKLGSGWKIVEL